jgi:hypothetical protein
MRWRTITEVYYLARRRSPFQDMIRYDCDPQDVDRCRYYFYQCSNWISYGKAILPVAFDHSLQS